MAHRPRQPSHKPLLPGLRHLVAAFSLAMVAFGVFWVLGKVTRLEVQTLPPPPAPAAKTSLPAKPNPSLGAVQ